MLVEIRGTNTENKGAQLMLEAVTDRFSDTFDLSVMPGGSEYKVRARLGLGQTMHERAFPSMSIRIGNMLPQRIRRRYGLVADSDIEGVLDASGFKYSDHFNIRSLRSEAVFARGWSKRNLPRVLLPQAFGPFTDSTKTRWITENLTSANLIYARDDRSMQYLHDLNLSARIERKPDFTVGLAPEKLAPVSEHPFVAIVPNTKMMSTGLINEKDYFSLLSSYCVSAANEGLASVIISHESTDRRFAQALAAQTKAIVFVDPSPRRIKAALGQAQAVVSSRYHAVVGSLSQGVPTLSLGWSHKYPALLADFGVPHWAAEVPDDPQSTLRSVLHDTEGINTVLAKRTVLLDDIDEMWADTEKVLARS